MKGTERDFVNLYGKYFYWDYIDPINCYYQQGGHVHNIYSMIQELEIFFLMLSCIYLLID